MWFLREDGVLENKVGVFAPTNDNDGPSNGWKGWNITIANPKSDTVTIENYLTKKVLGITCDTRDDFTSVIEEEFFSNYVGQEWFKGEPDGEGYFTLQNSNSLKPKFDYLTGSLRPKSITDNSKVPYLYLLYAGCQDERRCRI